MPQILIRSVQIVQNHAQLGYCWWPRCNFAYVTPRKGHLRSNNDVMSRVVLDSWVVSQIWLDSDSNESSQSSRPWKSRIWVESESNHADRHLSQELIQLDTAWVKVESMFFRGENVKILQLSVTLQRKNQPTATFDRTRPPPPINNFFSN